MKNTKLYLIFIILLYISFLSFFHISEIIIVTKEVRDMILNQLFPTLFPFMLIMTICQKIGIIQLIAYFLQYISLPIFNISGNAFSIYLFSILSGYPTNAKMIANAYSLTQIDDIEANLLVKCAHHGSFSFIVYFIGVQLFHDIKIGFMLELIHIFPTFLYLLFSKNKKAKKVSWDKSWQSFASVIESHNTFNSIKESLKECMLAFIYIFGFMLVCNVSLISLSHLFDAQLLLLFNGLLEFSSGIIQLSGSAYSFQIIITITAFYLSFGGLSVFLQVFQLMDDTPFQLKHYLLFRCFHALLSTLIIYLVLMN